MSKLVALKIDVSKIDKEKLYQGAKGIYLDAIVWLNDEADQYDNHGMITQSVSKEEREAGVKGAILGNAKVLMVKDDAPAPQAPKPIEPEQSDLPF